MFRRIGSYYSLLLISFLGVSCAITSVLCWGVINVKYKFAGSERSLFDLREHDSLRQLRILAGVDLPLGGSGRPDGLGLYYAKIGIGTPSKDCYVQVDTGSDIMWVNCIQCEECPKRSSLGIDLTLYDIKNSATGKLVSCDQEFCYAINGGQLAGCTANISCTYLEIYGDGSSTAGYFVKDIVLYDRVSGDLKTSSANGSVIFGFQQNLVDYQSLITRCVYDKQLDSGRGTLLHLCDEVIQQEVKEVKACFILAYGDSKETEFFQGR